MGIDLTLAPNVRIIIFSYTVHVIFTPTLLARLKL